MHDRLEPANVTALSGARILAVEDDYILLLDLTTLLNSAGAAAVRACGTVQQALDFTDTEAFSIAVLDVQVGRDNIGPVALKLAAMGTPFVFYTGQPSDDSTTAQWPEATVVSKPAQSGELVSALVQALGSSAQTP